MVWADWPVFADTHHFFALCAGVFEQGELDVEAVVRQPADTQRKIDFFRMVVADGFVQFHQGAAFFGDHQKAAGVFVEAVDEFEITRFGTGAADLFDDAEAHAAAAVDGNAGRFVDDQKRIVFVNESNSRAGAAWLSDGLCFSAMRIGGMRTVSPA